MQKGGGPKAVVMQKVGESWEWFKSQKAAAEHYNLSKTRLSYFIRNGSGPLYGRYVIREDVSDS
jgi:hypothetical protein